MFNRIMILKISYTSVRLIYLSALLTLLLGMLGYSAWAEDLPSASEQRPSSVKGLAFWLRADSLSLVPGTKVSKWADAEREGLFAFQPEEENQPVIKEAEWSDRPVVRFDGEDDFMIADAVTKSLVLAKGLTIFHVSALGRPTEEPGYVWSVHGHNWDDDIVRAGFNAERSFMLVAGAGLSDKKERRIKLLVAEGATSEEGRAHLVSATFVGQKAELRVDGKQVGSWDLSWPIAIGEGKYFSLGQEWDRVGPSNFFSGDLAELLVYTRVLTERERKSVEDYLKKRYTFVTQ